MKLANIRLARAADHIDLTDLTASQRTGAAYWLPGDTLVMPLDPEPTTAEAKRIRRRLVTVDDADEKRLADLLTSSVDPQAPTWARLALDAEVRAYGDPADLA